MLTGYTGERLLLTLWVGSLWAIGYLAVPIAFATLEITLAADYAGKLFYAVNVLGIISAVILLIGRLFSFGVKRFHLFWRSWILLLMLVLSIFFIAYVQPEMSTIRTLAWQSDAMLSARFDFLHKLSENLYLLLSLFGLLLVLTVDKRAEADEVS